MSRSRAGGLFVFAFVGAAGALDITFDVQVKVGEGSWEMWLERTDAIGAIYDEEPADYRFRVGVENRRTGTTTRWAPPGLLRLRTERRSRDQLLSWLRLRTRAP